MCLISTSVFLQVEGKKIGLANDAANPSCFCLSLFYQSSTKCVESPVTKKQKVNKCSCATKFLEHIFNQNLRRCHEN